MSETPSPSATTFRWLAAGVALFTIYGSLVPFHFVARPLGEAASTFQTLIETNRGISSKSDFVANVILGVPLGFALLAACCLDKGWSSSKKILGLLLLWPWCIVFSAAVEFSQLFFKERTCSPSDIYAQSLGSLVGLLAWLAFGHRFVKKFRRVWQGDRIGGTAGRLLFAYVGLLALVLLLPLDLTLSPAELFHKNFDGPQKIVMIPFSESDKLATWLALAGLYLPVGLLAGGLTRPPWNSLRGLPGVALRGLILASVLEAGQLFVTSRTTSLTDVILGTLGVLAGWGLTRAIRPVPSKGLSTELGLSLIQAWCVVLLVINWLPFDFTPGIAEKSFESVEWVPFATAYEKNYLNALEEASSKTLLMMPVGAAIAAIGVRRVIRRRTAIVVGVLVATVIEIGQLTLPGRITGPTDLIFGGLGSWLGCAAALRLRAYGYGDYQPPPPHNPVRFRVT